MSLAVIRSRSLDGLAAPEVTVEVHLANGLPSFTLVGLAETDEGRIDVLCGDAGIPVAVGVIETDGEVERVAVHL